MYHHTLHSQATTTSRPDNSSVAASPAASPDMAMSTSSSTTAHPESSSYVNDLPKEKVDAIIRKKRKAREPKACYPCHARKVKCDKQFPCDGCVKRGHGDLCSYGRQPPKRRVTEAGNDQAGESHLTTTPYHNDSPSGEEGNPAILQIPRQDWEGLCERMKSMEGTMTQLRTTLEHISSMTTSIKESTMAPPSTSVSGHASAADRNQNANTPESDNAETDDTMSGTANDGEGGIHTGQLSNRTEHLGSKSIIAYILGHPNISRNSAHSILKNGVLPKLGLGNESAFPFVDLWSTTDPAYDVEQIISVLPEDEVCLTYFRAYRDVTAALYPVLPNVDQFGRDIEHLLRNRAVALSNPSQSRQTDANGLIYGMSMEFYGLCFAVLAAGCLASDQPARQLSSRIFVSCSYQCLRATNYLSRPTVHTTKTFLIIGSVLAYNMNPGMCYLILGISMRMGFMLGFHTNSNFSPAESFVRRYTWWAIAWQDSHFALSYDRPSAMVFARPEIPYASDSAPGRRSYFESLCCLISLTLNIVRERMFHPRRPMSVASIYSNMKEMERILQDASPHIRDGQQCLFNRQHVERLGLKLHSSYIRSELSRPALKPQPGFSDQDTNSLKQCCVNDLAKTVEAYIEIHNICPQAARSWIIIQRTISCAFLLAVIGESKKNARIWSLLRQLENVIARRAAEEDDNFQGKPASDGNILQTEPKPAATMPVGVTTPIPDQSQTASTPMGWANPPGNAAVQNGDPYSTMSSAYFSNTAPSPQDLQKWSTENIAKSLRAIHKLNDGAVNVGIPPEPGSAEQTSSLTSLPVAAPAPTGGATSGNFGFYGPTIPGPESDGAVASGDEGGTMAVPGAGVPRSVSSGSDNLDTVLDRATGYINPPLWY